MTTKDTSSKANSKAVASQVKNAEKTSKARPFALFLLGLGLLGLLGYVLVESERLETENKVRVAAAEKKGAPQRSALQTDIIQKPNVTPKIKPAEPKADIQIVDVTKRLQAFPERVVASVKDEKEQIEKSAEKSVKKVEVMPAPIKNIEAPKPAPSPAETVRHTSEILQATLTLAKLQAERQTQLAQLHTVMGLLQNPTQDASARQDWAALALKSSQKLNAKELVAALEAYLTPVAAVTEGDSAESAVENSGRVDLPALLAPFKNLITIKRVDASEPDSGAQAEGTLADVLAAYRAFLMKESEE